MFLIVISNKRASQVDVRRGFASDLKSFTSNKHQIRRNLASARAEGFVVNLATRLTKFNLENEIEEKANSQRTTVKGVCIWHFDRNQANNLQLVATKQHH